MSSTSGGFNILYMAQQQKTDAQIKYERKVKAPELTIKSQGKPIMSKTLIDVAKKIE